MGTGKIRLNLIRGHLLKLRLKSEFGHRRGLKLTYEGSLGYSCILLIYTTKAEMDAKNAKMEFSSYPHCIANSDFLTKVGAEKFI